MWGYSQRGTTAAFPVCFFLFINIVLYSKIDLIRCLGLAVGPLWHHGLIFGRDFEHLVPKSQFESFFLRVSTKNIIYATLLIYQTIVDT